MYPLSHSHTDTAAGVSQHVVNKLTHTHTEFRALEVKGEECFTHPGPLPGLDLYDINWNPPNNRPPSNKDWFKNSLDSMETSPEFWEKEENDQAKCRRADLSYTMSKPNIHCTYGDR